MYQTKQPTDPFRSFCRAQARDRLTDTSRNGIVSFNRPHFVLKAIISCRILYKILVSVSGGTAYTVAVHHYCTVARGRLSHVAQLITVSLLYISSRQSFILDVDVACILECRRSHIERTQAAVIQLAHSACARVFTTVIRATIH